MTSYSFADLVIVPVSFSDGITLKICQHQGFLGYAKGVVSKVTVL